MDSLTLATWVLAVVTAGYLASTIILVRQNRKLVARQTRPEVIAFAEVTDKHAVNLVVQNMGAGVARNVRVDAPSNWTALDELGRLGDIGFVAKGIGVLPIGARVHSLIAMMLRLDSESLQPIKIDLTYEDIDGEGYGPYEFRIDLREMLGIRPGSTTAPGSLVGGQEARPPQSQDTAEPAKHIVEALERTSRMYQQR